MKKPAVYKTSILYSPLSSTKRAWLCIVNLDTIYPYSPMVHITPVFLTTCGLVNTLRRETCSIRVLADWASRCGTGYIPSEVESVEKWRPRFPIHLLSSSGTSSLATVVPVGENTSSLSLALPLTDPADILALGLVLVGQSTHVVEECALHVQS